MPPRQRVLITGASGHVGGRLLAHIISNPSLTPRALMRSRTMLAPWVANSDVMFGDLGNRETRARALEDVDCVVHLATRGFSAAVTPTKEALANEEHLTLELVSDARAAGVRRFMYISSIHVYGESLVDRVNELTPAKPTTEYGRSRQRIEQEILGEQTSTSTEIVVVRLTNSFGTPAIPRQETWNLLLHDLCRQVVRYGSISLRSDGRICRDTMALRDVVFVLSQLALQPPGIGGVFLLASGETLTLSQIAELVQQCSKEVFGVTVGMSIETKETEPPPSYSLDSAKLRATGITIPQNRDEEIRDLLRFAQQEFGAENS